MLSVKEDKVLAEKTTNLVWRSSSEWELVRCCCCCCGESNATSWLAWLPFEADLRWIQWGDLSHSSSCTRGSPTTLPLSQWVWAGLSPQHHRGNTSRLRSTHRWLPVSVNSFKLSVGPAVSGWLAGSPLLISQQRCTATSSGLDFQSKTRFYF